MSCVVGLALLGLAVHTTDEKTGAVAFWGGLTLGNAGVFGSLLWLYLRSENRE